MNGNNESSVIFDLDSDALQTAEFFAARTTLESLIGQTIVGATIEKGRTSISTSDGLTVVFCEFGGVVKARQRSD